MTTGPKSRKTRALDALRARVLTCALPPGEDLDEAALCAEFGLSRTPLRELCRQLAGEGYLSLTENRAPRVSELSFATLREFFLAAPMIYAAILRLAAVNARPPQIAALRAAQEAFRASLAAGDSAARALANNRFHEITGEMAANPYLAPSFQRLLIDHARISMTFYRPQTDAMARNVALACDQHDRIIDAISAGDAEAAGQLAIDHWNLSRGQIEMFVMPAGLSEPLGRPGIA